MNVLAPYNNPSNTNVPKKGSVYCCYRLSSHKRRHISGSLQPFALISCSQVSPGLGVQNMICSICCYPSGCCKRLTHSIISDTLDITVWHSAQNMICSICCYPSGRCQRRTHSISDTLDISLWDTVLRTWYAQYIATFFRHFQGLTNSISNSRILDMSFGDVVLRTWYAQYVATILVAVKGSHSISDTLDMSLGDMVTCTGITRSWDVCTGLEMDRGEKQAQENNFLIGHKGTNISTNLPSLPQL
jgi:hypothetical protein